MASFLLVANGSACTTRPGIAEYWIVDLEHDLIEQHQEPVAGRYTRLARCRRGETLIGATLRALTLAVADILAEPLAL